ncbi:MAG: anti-sigma factor antagonist [Lachnospiraceae bacterium]|nr:anti-sigma factor antagonist [Lachnospiraceae bacterium]
MDYRIQEDYLYVFLPTELDHHSTESIRRECDELLYDNEILHIVFDFGETSFMDSSGIGVLMGRYRMISKLGGDVTAIHVNDRVYKILNLAGLHKVMEISQEKIWNKRM